MWKWLSKQIVGTAGKPQTPAETLYYSLLEASRTPDFYLEYGVRDDFDGRFDLLCLLVSLTMRRLRDCGEEAKPFSQELFDAMFTDIDLTLREQGAGDTGLGKRIRMMSEGFAGRLQAYSAALDAADEDGLAAAIARNFGRREEVSAPDRKLAQVTMRLEKGLAQTDYTALSSGQFVPVDWVRAHCAP